LLHPKGPQPAPAADGAGGAADGAGGTCARMAQRNAIGPGRRVFGFAGSMEARPWLKKLLDDYV